MPFITLPRMLSRAVSSPKICAAIALLLAVICCSGSIVFGAKLVEQRPGPGSGAYTIDAILNSVVNRLRLDLNDQATRYSLLYSGRILRIRVGRDMPWLVGVSPRDIVFAYYNGVEWVVLPARVYTDAIRSNLTTVYLMPERITPSTIIDVRLPSRRSLYTIGGWTTPSIIPEFARAARCVRLDLIDPFYRSVLTRVYLFIGGSVRWSLAGYQTLSSYRYASVNDFFTAPEEPGLTRYMIASGFSMKTISIVDERIRETVLDAGRNIVIKPYWLPPVPGRGGDSGVYRYNLVELRPQPLISMIKRDYQLNSTTRSHSMALYVLDPQATGVTWKTLRLTLVAYPDKTRYVVRTLNITIARQDSSYTRSFTIYGHKKNIIVLQWTPSAYGVSWRSVSVKVSINGISGDERWYYRIFPAVFIKWSYNNITDERAKPLTIYPLVKSKLEFMIGPQSAEDEEIIPMRPLQMLSVPKPDGVSIARLRLEIAGGTESMYPITAEISFGGIARCTVSFSSPGEREYCNLILLHEDIVQTSLKREAIPVSARIIAHGTVDMHTIITLYVDTVSPAIIPIRAMYELDHSNTPSMPLDAILYSSTRLASDPIWAVDTYVIKGELLFATAQEYNGDIYTKSFNVILSRNDEDHMQDYGYKNYRLITDTRGINDVYVCTETTCYTLENNLLDDVWINITFNKGETIAEVKIGPNVFNPSGTVPSLPEIPPLLSLALSLIPYASIGEEIYSNIQWGLSRIKEEQENTIDTTIDTGSNSIVIHWHRGMFSGTELYGDIYMIDIYVPKNLNPNNSIKVDMELRFNSVPLTIDLTFEAKV